MKRHRDTEPLTKFSNNDTLPHDENLERAVLGALLASPDAVPDVRGIITAEAFDTPDNATIYDAICRLDDEGKGIDLVSVASTLKGTISAAYLAGLLGVVGTGVEVRNHARRLFDLQLRRRLILYASEIIAKAGTDADALEWAVSGLDEITGTAVRIDGARPIGEVMGDVLRDLERRQQLYQRGDCVGITTGLPMLDRITGGWRPAQLVVLAARPAMGKTAIARHFARSAAAAGVPVCFFSLEMTNAQLVGRMLVGASGVNANAFRRGSVTSDDWAKIEPSAEMLAGIPIHTCDTSNISMTRIRAQARAMQRRGRCGMVVIDYLQLIEGTDDRRNMNREREVAQMSRGAKLLAKELGVPVVLLAQLSRKVEERTDKTPLLADLRESGAIEQDADTVIFIDRPAVYSPEYFDGGRYGMVDPQGVGRLTIAKNREGGTGFILFRHNESLTRIEDYEAYAAEAAQDDNAPY